ncbi:thermonuclease family protein [Neobacillus niacini]|uniref:thermonuclease family protein n=1 Tax=Neobacillus niacini TaxID=86668 RepID=UPI0025596859|nr:thermonuclease family protein [Neobacillus niacini]
MRKQLAGTALLTAAALFMVNLPDAEQTDSGVNQQQKKRDSHSEVVFMPEGQVPVSFVETIDGDTIKVIVMGKIETVRYLLVGTPESKKPGTCVQPYAKQAFERNNELVQSGLLTLEVEQGNTRDAYGRLLAYVYVDGKSVQEMLLQEGLARVGYIMNPPYKYLKLYKDDENLARRSQINIWSRSGLVTNWGFDGFE